MGFLVALLDLYVAVGGTGDGSMAAPFGSVQAALDVAVPGDVIHVDNGTYTAGFVTKRAGMEGAPITVRGGPQTLITVAGRVLTVSHPYHVFENMKLDAQYADQDAVRIETAGTGTVLRALEVRRAQRDCIDMGSPANVLIEQSLIHHCLNSTGGRTDAHGIVGAGVRDLTIRETEIHTFSGDAIQFDPGRTTPAWDRITIDSCTFWLAPTTEVENGFPVGTVAGENAVDTKVPAGAKSHLVIRNTTAYGFRDGLIGNMAAYNLKEGVVAELDRVTIWGSEIALRLRAPAEVRVQNAVIYESTVAVRYEDDIVAPKLYSSTIGSGVMNAFVEASSPMTKFDAKNLLVFGTTLPPELPAIGGSMAVDATVFQSAVEGDYRLIQGAAPIDRGTVVDVATDRDGVSRPQGASHDVGAFEYCAGECAAAPDGGAGGPGRGNNSDSGGCCRTDRGPTSPTSLLGILLVALSLLRRSTIRTWRPRRD